MPIGRDVAELVASISEDNIDVAHQVLEHLKLFCEEGAKPTTKDVLRLFHYHPDPNEFQLLEKIFTKSPAEAERMVFELFEKGKNAFLLLNLLGKSISRLVHMQSLMKTGTAKGELAQALGISPWLVDKEAKLLKRIPPPRLKRALKAIITADSQLKSKSLGTELVFSQLIHSL